MMLQNFICPDGGLQPVKDCLAGRCRMAERCAPLSYLTLAGQERKWSGKPSTTQLLNGTRQAFLQLTTDYDEKPVDKTFAILGTGVHALLEESEDTSSYNEEKVIFENITGIMDRIEQQPDNLWYLQDFKVSGSYKVAKVLGYSSEYKDILNSDGTPVRYKTGKKAGQIKQRKEFIQGEPDFGDWQWQLNFYRIAEEKFIGYPISKIKLFVVVRDGGTYIATQRGVEENHYYLDIPMLPDSEVINYFRMKRDALLYHLEGSILPPMCTDGENWDGKKCQRFCPVAETCQSIGDNKWLPNRSVA